MSLFSRMECVYFVVMHIKKLFGVLVVGGSLLVSGCTDETEDREQMVVDVDATESSDASENSTDGSLLSPDASPQNSSDATAAALCFCNTDTCCERDDEGNGTLQSGFECCWNTSC